MSYFSEKTPCRVFFVSECQNLPIGFNLSEIQAFYKNYNITFLGCIHTFSIRHLGAFFKSGWWLRKQLKIHQIDLVHILFVTPHALWGLFINTPYILTTRGSDILQVLPSLLSKSGLNGLYNKILFLFFKFSFCKAYATTGTSSAQVHTAQTLFKLKKTPVVIRTGVDVLRIAELNKPELLNVALHNKPFIFSPRFFSPVYDIELQLNAIELLPRNIIKNFYFVFVRGKKYNPAYANNLYEKLKLLQAKIGLSYIVEEYLSQETIWMYYKKATLTIMTPLSDGTPNSALEAMAANCPLILPKLNYDPELFENTTLVLENRNSHTLAQLIKWGVENYDPHMIEYAHSRVLLNGNRQTEMEKLYTLYTAAFNQ
jgi:glycosyltransferase involved in cell wall biosynthesis